MKGPKVVSLGPHATYGVEVTVVGSSPNLSTLGCYLSSLNPGYNKSEKTRGWWVS